MSGVGGQVGEGFMEAVGMGQVHGEHVKFTNIEMQDEGRSGDGHSLGRALCKQTQR